SYRAKPRSRSQPPMSIDRAFAVEVETGSPTVVLKSTFCQTMIREWRLLRPADPLTRAKQGPRWGKAGATELENELLLSAVSGPASLTKNSRRTPYITHVALLSTIR